MRCSKDHSNPKISAALLAKSAITASMALAITCVDIKQRLEENPSSDDHAMQLPIFMPAIPATISLLTASASYILHRLNKENYAEMYPNCDNPKDISYGKALGYQFANIGSSIKSSIGSLIGNAKNCCNDYQHITPKV